MQLLMGYALSLELLVLFYVLRKKQPQYCPIPIVWCILYPVLNELIYNLFANLVG
jgi:hypothetical protein